MLIVRIAVIYLLLSSFGYLIFWNRFPKYNTTLAGRLLLVFLSWSGIFIVMVYSIIIMLPKFFYQWVFHGTISNNDRFFQ